MIFALFGSMGAIAVGVLAFIDKEAKPLWPQVFLGAQAFTWFSAMVSFSVWPSVRDDIERSSNISFGYGAAFGLTVTVWIFLMVAMALTAVRFMPTQSHKNYLTYLLSRCTCYSSSNRWSYFHRFFKRQEQALRNLKSTIIRQHQFLASKSEPLRDYATPLFIFPSLHGPNHRIIAF